MGGRRKKKKKSPKASKNPPAEAGAQQSSISSRTEGTAFHKRFFSPGNFSESPSLLSRSSSQVLTRFYLFFFLSLSFLFACDNKEVVRKGLLGIFHRGLSIFGKFTVLQLLLSLPQTPRVVRTPPSQPTTQTNQNFPLDSRLLLIPTPPHSPKCPSLDLKLKTSV